MSFVVITDTSGNLLNRHVKDYDLKLLPFSYYINGEEHTCLDTDAFNGDSFYSGFRKDVKITTSQINPQTYADCFEKYLKEGSDIIYVSMSSGISGSCQSSFLAAEMLLENYPNRRIEIIDTMGASLGEGLIAIRAAHLRDKGIDIDNAVKELRSLSERMFNVFTVDDLMFLRRGGRLSNLSAIVGTVLHIKPILKGSTDGQIVAFGKVRGRKRSIEVLGEMYRKYVVNPEQQTVGIAHAGCLEDALMLKGLLNQTHPPKEILIVDYEPVTGSHVGPGALALFFESNPGIRAIDTIA